MNRSILALVVVAFTACPPPVTKPDAGDDDGGINVDPKDACSGGCAVNQRCDIPTRTCRDGCEGNCDGGFICQAVNRDAGVFQCVQTVTTCNGQTCPQGEVACLGSSCSCLGPARGTTDSCFGGTIEPGGGSWCGPQGHCTSPKKFQQCKADGTACPTGFACNPVFGDVNNNDVCDLGDLCVCTKACSAMVACDRGELCSGVGCLTSGLFSGQECSILVPADAGYYPDGGAVPGDGGTVIRTVTVGNRCLRKDNGGNPTETTPSGTCTYSFFYLADRNPIAFTTCRPPGGVTENNECVADPSIIAQATQCDTGLECAAMRPGDKGVCLRTCNALPPSVAYPDPQPGCGTNEACVNLYRREDIGRDGALLGVCAPKCNVFDPARSACANFGTFPAVCVPTNPDGFVPVSNDGSGICVPLRASPAPALDAPCDSSDPFKGAVCGAGQICPPATPTVASVCTRVCDTECAGASPPARCATEVNATCPAGKTCRKVTSDRTSRLGFCQ